MVSKFVDFPRRQGPAHPSPRGAAAGSCTARAPVVNTRTGAEEQL
ncbi:hypothetical protein I545_6890 [Mycobacterium kansasii 662]|uniref:Uncharacterized protein n=1 Tax=Mycobacterium kansasii 662 TaxID=1299326 RepID=X7XRI1_MYCKA|nr:hypothetical protein I545_6890 [Mycobacterium kansasii 662]